MYNTRGASRVLLILLWIVMLAVSLTLVATFLGMFSTGPSPSGQSLASLDWAGYIVASDFAQPEPVVTGVNASWFVPRVNVSPQDAFSAVWIGIGGQEDHTLIQAGTEQDSVDGEAAYYAWYELLPNDSITITTVNISPGDEIEASIHLLDSTTNAWSIEIVDVTNGQDFKSDFYYNSSRLSADWIVERATVNNALSRLADFGSVTFTGSSAILNNNVGRIDNFPFFPTVMYDRRNRQLVTVSSLDPDGSSFTVSYLG